MPSLIGELGEGGFAKVFKAKFHAKDVAMKYIPLDKVKDQYQYYSFSYGLHELYNQEKVRYYLSEQAELTISFLKVCREPKSIGQHC